MIQQLYIQDFAVIDKLDLEFGPGLNVLTGETGAGKSIIVDAINIVLGERADMEAIRSGAEKAVIEAVLAVDHAPEAAAVLENAGLSPDDGRIIVSRELHKAGKSQCRINGRPVTVSLLKEITDGLVDIHGQHDHQSLLRPESHLGILDEWCGPNVTSLRVRIADQYANLRRLKGELDRLRNDERERARNIDLYQFQIDEIESAKLSPDEEEELQSDRVRLANAEKLHAAASTAYESLGDRAQDTCALDKLSESVEALQGLSELDTKLQPLVETLQAALYQVEDATRELRSYRDSVEFNPERLEAVEERLDLIRGLKRKYGETIESILAYGRSLKDKLDALANSEERTAELVAEIEQVESSVMREAEALSGLRRTGGAAFAESVVRELAGLSMPNAVFQVSQEPKELDSTGIDRIEFLISANPGEPAKPLARIASGGEMSRIMLAMKSVAASADKVPTLIFDEIDVGIGGRTAEVVGEKLDFLAGGSQVLCVTHLPQIASRPGAHYGIEKQLQDGRTVVRVRRLTEEERVSELARMLGGTDTSETAVRHARELLSSRARS